VSHRRWNADFSPMRAPRQRAMRAPGSSDCDANFSIGAPDRAPTRSDCRGHDRLAHALPHETL